MNKKCASVWRRIGMVALPGMAMVAMSGQAAAVENGFYIAADYASSKFSQTAADFDAQLEPFLECSFAADPYYCTSPGDVVFNSTSIEKKAKGYNVSVGYHFTHWFALEGTYVNFGKTHHVFDGTLDLGPVDVDGDTITDYDGPQPLRGRSTFRTRGPAVSAVGELELGRFLSVDARAGLFFADNKYNLELRYSPPTGDEAYSTSGSDGKTKFFYGATATFWITHYFGVRGGYSGFSKGSFDHTVKQYFVGIRYSYGY